MATRTPLHEILDQEAKARLYKRCGVGWAKDHGDLVADIRLDRHKNIKGKYSCWISLFIKLDHVPSEFTDLIDEFGFSPRMIHIYIPPNRAPDRTSHLLKIVNQPTMGPFSEDYSFSDAQKELRQRIEDSLRLDRNGRLTPGQASDARGYIVEWGFDQLDVCTSREELKQRFHRGDPPFGVILRYAGKYFG